MGGMPYNVRLRGLCSGLSWFRLLCFPAECTQLGNTTRASLTIPREQSTSTTARYAHPNCVRVVPPEDGQVMPETCRGFEF
jgi:hypothetical protein